VYGVGKYEPKVGDLINCIHKYSTEKRVWLEQDKKI
jgi:hypothetical protein